jgi:5-methyltetrahydropteroyltriglutamate--homocysteine methyltransferase
MRDIETIPLLTTVAGSYPTGGLPARRAMQRAIEDQIAAGVELVSDGQVRGDIIGLFASRIPGFRQTGDGTWEIEDALDLPQSPTAVMDYAFARSLVAERAELKGIVTGPITLALSSRIAASAPYSGPADPSLLLRLSEILSHEVAALVAGGARVVQIDEPMLGAALGSRVSPELVYDALRKMAAIPRISVLHACGDVRQSAPELLLLPFGVLHIENTRIANLDAMDPDMLAAATSRMSVGCVDTQTEDVEHVDVIFDRISAAARVVESDRLWISPDCGLRRLPPEAARDKLRNMVLAARRARIELL